MIHRVEIVPLGQADPVGAGAANEIRLLGIDSVRQVSAGRVFLIEGELSEDQVRRIASDLLADPVVEQFHVGPTRLDGKPSPGPGEKGDSPPFQRTQKGDSPLLVEVFPKPGVMDPVALSTEKAIAEMGLTVQTVRTGRIYRIASTGPLTDAQVRTILTRVLANDCIEQATVGSIGAAPPPHAPEHEFQLVRVPIREASDERLVELSARGHLFLNLVEMQAIRDYYRRIGREPTDIELETLAQTWSEHCVHKTLRSDIEYRGVPIPGLLSGQWSFSSVEELDQELPAIQQAMLDAGYEGEQLHDWVPAGLRKALSGVPQGTRIVARLAGDAEGHVELTASGQRIVGWGKQCLESGRPYVDLRIRNLIRSTIFAATEKLNKPWCISVFQDNAGVIEFDGRHAVCFKVETHNHPSAIEPYGGAATGIGGCIRDPMGTGLGAKPIANTDIFCFAPPDTPADRLPKGVLHPRRVMRGVVGGVRDYGNRMGIPTVNGAVFFDPRYLGNPLVFCGNVGLMDRDKCFKHPRSGQAIVLVGGRTGRDGIHGATFSSGELTHSHEDEFSHAVQIGNAITEKTMSDVLNQARARGLYSAITDCGAGGLSSAVGEMGEHLGARVNLETVPLKYAGLSYTEIWISEAQERMVLAVPQENVEELLALFAAEDVEATVIGQFADDRILRLFYRDTPVGELDMEFLHDGLPRYTRKAEWPANAEPGARNADLNRPLPPSRSESHVPSSDLDHTPALLALLGHWNIASKEWIVRQYDHEVQGGSAVKPLVGAANDGPGDGAVLTPVLGSTRGIALACGLSARLGDIDPYQMALHAIDECVRNLVCVGADVERIAILDNFCWGNCAKPDRLGSLVLAAQACHDGAIAYSAPFISGKDSLNNEFVAEDGTVIAIPPTLLISGIAIVSDVRMCVTMDAKSAGNALFVVGVTDDALAGSHYEQMDAETPRHRDAEMSRSAATPQACASIPRVDLVLGPGIARAVAAAIAAGLVRAAHDASEGGLAVAMAEMCFAGGLGLTAALDGLPARAAASQSRSRSNEGPAVSGLSPAAALFAESPSRYLLEVEPARLDDLHMALDGIPHVEVGRFNATARLELTLAGQSVISADLAALKSAWQAPLGWR